MSRLNSYYALGFLSLACMVFTALPSRAANTIYGIHNRASSGLFQLFLNLETNGAVCASHTLFGINGGLYRATFLDGMFYAIELDNNFVDNYLVKVPHVPDPFIVGGRVSSTPTAFTNVESIVACEGALFATAFDFASHITTLFTVNTNSGLGTAIGPGSFNGIYALGALLP